jgi:hypothetical protein
MGMPGYGPRNRAGSGAAAPRAADRAPHRHRGDHVPGTGCPGYETPASREARCRRAAIAGYDRGGRRVARWVAGAFQGSSGQGWRG